MNRSDWFYLYLNSWLPLPTLLFPHCGCITESSPRSILREERLAKLHAMSSKDDYSNLKQPKTVVPLTQAEMFPRIGHVRQLSPVSDSNIYFCKLKMALTV